MCVVGWSGPIRKAKGSEIALQRGAITQKEVKKVKEEGVKGRDGTVVLCDE